ncbi:dehydratase [[Haemophilus] felis]|uniref:Dehydratase n=1 Tax=[Haemophilus] felis TaxID=123822 RepID=A0A1T0B0B3_9PAST|nr:dehydratase [[Haemophilus] felis]NBI41549.1 dehydratase [[Haemophilus] felis]OOS03514.1 dehydratase [[Haemophilus] felis]
MTKIDLTCPIHHVATLVPHSGDMVLLDRITEFGDDFLTAETQIRADNPLIKNGKLATFAGIEIMAQGVAAWAGCIATLAGEPIRLGYLLGTRKLHIHSEQIAIGTQLRIQIKMSIQDATGFGVFDSQLIDSVTEQVLLEGALNVFSPK